MKFVHLHVHSHYSLLDGLSKIPDLIAKAKEQGSNALALTDHGVMYGVIEFYEGCLKAGIKPIVGCEVYVVSGSLSDKAPTATGKKDYFHLTLLAYNYAGYLNLMKISTKAHVDGYYYRPRIDHDFLEQHAEGLIAMSGCLRGELPAAILADDERQIAKLLDWHQKVFPNNYYLELQHHPNIANQQRVNERLKSIARERGLPLVATCDSHYLCADDVEAHDVLLCVQTGAKVTDETRFSMRNEVFDLTDPEELIKAFNDVPEAISNTQKIADQCEVKIDLGKIVLPKFDLPEGETLRGRLLAMVEVGTKRRFGDNPSEAVKQRLDYELSVICQMNYESYFLVVADFIHWAKDQGIVVGPGRGSGAASMVSYVLDITDLNPLEYDLIFERFLNPERISMPDFDIDFADDRRGEVIEYVVGKYGKNRVAQIVTFGTMAARASVRDTGRALGFSYAEVDRIAKLIPFGASLSEAIKSVDELKGLYERDAKVKKLIDLAKKLEGVVRHTSVHAAGVVIADKDLVNYTPLQTASKGDISLVTQYSMFPIEKLGLLKIDFLGLKNLTIIKNALRIIRKTKGVELDIAKLPLDDKPTYQLLSKGLTTGVFQLESDGMKRNLQLLKPMALSDIIAMVALYRPGPIELIPEFIDRKNGKHKIEYLHPKLEPILKETYGIAVYQEQVLRIARDLCGFTMGEADVLRKAIGKKIGSLLLEQKKKFIEGGVANGVTRSVAEKLFEFVEPFARYGFNKAHASCYGMIAYQTAYLKTHYPNEFLAALMTSDQGDLDKVAKNIAEAEHMKIKVLPPSVNESFTDFAVVKDTGNIRFGLNVIKNVGRKVSDLVVEERKTNGIYVNLEDFLKRVPKDALNKKTLESLAKAGALDDFGDRRQLFDNVESMVEFVNRLYRTGDIDQLGIFGADVAPATVWQLKPGPLSTEKERLAWEKELLGTFVSKHPLKELGPKLAEFVTPINSLHEDSDNKQVKVGGIIASIQKVKTRTNDEMMFMRLEDLTGSLEVIVFPKVLQAVRNLLTTDRVVVIEGRVNVKDRVSDEDGEIIIRSEAKIIAETIKEVTELSLAELKQALPQRQSNGGAIPAPAPVNANRYFRYRAGNLIVRLPREFGAEKLKSLKQLLEQHPGEVGVEIEVFAKNIWQRLKTTTKITQTRELERDLIRELTN
ncbi:DNA polymerase III subunit alpha [Patescibacteria group bacterium]|nr:DNA polymerase III subunit alpha [Patescibacteria group bacterium]